MMTDGEKHNEVDPALLERLGDASPEGTAMVQTIRYERPTGIARDLLVTTTDLDAFIHEILSLRARLREFFRRYGIPHMSG